MSQPYQNQRNKWEESGVDRSSQELPPLPENTPERMKDIMLDVDALYARLKTGLGPDSTDTFSTYSEDYLDKPPPL